MALTAHQKKLLNNMTPGSKVAGLGDALQKALVVGVAVPNAASAPTQAEFNALLASLRGAGVIATA